MKHNMDVSDSLLMLDEAIQTSKGDVKYAYVGGVITDLLNDPDTTIDVKHQQIKAADAPIKRLRENGTPRDVDIFYFTDNRKAIEEFHHRLSDEILDVRHDRTPLISISSYEKEVKKRAIIQLVSQSSKEGSTVKYSVGDIYEAIDEAVIEDLWTMQYRGKELPVFHPVAHMYMYHVRSVAGIRVKDHEKVSVLDGKLRECLPHEEFEQFSPLLDLERRLSTELSLRGIIKSRALNRAGLLVGKKLMERIEKTPSLMNFLQRDSPLIKSAVHRVIKGSRNNFREVDPNTIRKEKR